ncbi:C4-dicarboxylate ABC transporter substrate-binding protein [Marinomonas ushuaiensis DSM 15871]|uniref:TRAP transporter small permease protein n=1 Tax=Marinomonas ushuaiensis DSM 15871 TaxID=1122207 RepID=X7E708_9GAMM|nr:TRAP transporter small permease subunit [Marinomonas ushuaiensis]ETX11854.1 C4-dicarboxylate ABC transporter substrate-binding protein [Marinomonas ushuaiensis DSM 15871]
MILIKLLEMPTRFFGGIAALLIIPLIGALIVEVFSRHILGTPTVWAFEISYMVMGTLFVLGMANALRLKQHVSVDLLTMKMSPRVASSIRVVFYIMLLPIIIWLTWELAHYFYEAYESGERSGRSAWNPIVWPIYFTWFLGFLLLVMQLVAELLKAILTMISGKEDDFA